MKVPVVLEEMKVTVPVGEDPPVTAAVQVVDEPTTTFDGEQVTDVVVGWTFEGTNVTGID
jgi:hypothetical protein